MTSDLGRASAPLPRRWGRIAASVALAVGTVGAAFVLVVGLNVTIYLEASVPPRSALPDLPEGLRISDVREGCGSGDCHLEFDVIGEGLGAEQVLARLPRGGCGASGLIDRRPRCLRFEVDAVGVVRGTVSTGDLLP